VLGETEALTLLRLAVRRLTDDEEITQIGDDHQAVGVEIPRNLFRPGRKPGIVLDGLHLHDTALGHLSLARLAALELPSRIKPEIRMTCARVLEVRQADDALPQPGAYGIQEIVEGSVLGALSRPRAKAMN